MARRSVIAEHGAGPRVLLLAAGGKSSRLIADQLAREGIKLSHVAVQSYLKQHGEEHAEATENVRAAVETQVMEQALDDVKLLQELRDMALDTLRTATKEDRLSKEWAAVMGQAKAVIDLRLKIAGANRPNEGEGTNKPSAYANVADLSDAELEELIRDDKKPGPGP